MRAEILQAIIEKIRQANDELKNIVESDVTVSDCDIAVIKPPKIVVKILKEDVNRYITGNVSRYDASVLITIVLTGNVLQGLVTKLLVTIDKIEEILHNRTIVVNNKPALLYLTSFKYDVALEERTNGYTIAEMNFELRR